LGEHAEPEGLMTGAALIATGAAFARRLVIAPHPNYPRGPRAFLAAECREPRARLQVSFDDQLATTCQRNEAWLRGS
jgi:hypothetical protein